MEEKDKEEGAGKAGRAGHGEAIDVYMEGNEDHAAGAEEDSEDPLTAEPATPKGREPPSGLTGTPTRAS
eukprot:13595132-Alexandrium_andersonii.AAC.1